MFEKTECEIFFKVFCMLQRFMSKHFIDCFSQIFPSALRVAREDDPEKRLEQFNTLQSKLEELEKHLATTGQPYLTGLKPACDLCYDKQYQPLASG